MSYVVGIHLDLLFRPIFVEISDVFLMKAGLPKLLDSSDPNP